MDSGGGYYTKSRGLGEISLSEIYHREFDLARKFPPCTCMTVKSFLLLTGSERLLGGQTCIPRRLKGGSKSGRKSGY